MKSLNLILIVLGIYIYEAYWPVPNTDKQQVDTYYEKSKLYQEKLGIPIEISIFFKIDSAEKAKKLAKKYPNCQFKSTDIWIKYISPELNWGEIKQIKKFQNAYRKISEN